MSKKVSVRLLLFLIGLFILSFNILIFYQRNTFKNLQSKFYEEYKSLSHQNFQLINSLSKYLENIYLPLYTNNIEPNNAFLVWVYPANGCNICIQNELELLKKNIERIGINNIIVVSKNSNQKELYSLLYSNNIAEMRIVSFAEIELRFVAKSNENESIYFILKDNSAKMIFFTNKELPNISELYFDKIIKEYFKKQSFKF